MVLFTNAQLAFTCHGVEGWYIVFNNFPAYLWLSACIQFFQKMCGEGCRIFRILCFHARFMFVMSFLKITCQSYVGFLPSITIFDTLVWLIVIVIFKSCSPNILITCLCFPCSLGVEEVTPKPSSLYKIESKFGSFLSLHE